jgi:molybdenum cofactor synthesis domain-containing protein
VPRTAAILVIGDEVLSGKVVDENAAFLIRELRDLGVDLRRVLVIPDVIDEIAQETRSLSARCDFVFSSGGVGPTHDDVTMEGVAQAFDRKVVRHPELERLLRDFYGPALCERNLRMADVPEGATLIAADHKSWPVCAVENVFVLPGVPLILRRKFLAIRERFRDAPFHLRAVYLNADEGAIAGHLDEVHHGFPDVHVGSYPRIDVPDYRIKVTLDGRDAERVDAARDALVQLLPPAALVRTE